MSPFENAESDFSFRLRRIESKARQNDLTLRELLEGVGPKGGDFFSLLLVLPFLQPIPLVGLSLPLGLAVMSLSFSQMLRNRVWLPRRLEKIALPSAGVIRLCEAAARVFAFLERRSIRGKCPAFFERTSVERFLAGLIFFHAFLLALPLPIPATNFVPSVVIFLIAIAGLEDDLYFLIAGLFAAVLNAIFFAALAVGVSTGLRF